MKNIFGGIFLCCLISCTDGGMTSPSFTPGGNTNVPSVSSSNSGTSGVSVDSGSSDVDTIGLRRGDIKVETTCEGSVTFTVPASNASYFNVWIPRVNDGTKYGPFNFNGELAYGTISLSPGRYDYQLAVELRIDGGIIQDDRHHGSFEIVACGSTPHTPEIPTDVCPNIDGNQTEVPEGLVLIDGQCVKPPNDCSPEWEPIGEPEVSYGEWSECVEGSQHRTITTVITLGNQCNQETYQKSSEEIEYQECELPPPECIPIWTEGDPYISDAGEYGECSQTDLGWFQSRLVQYRVDSTNQCNDEQKSRFYTEINSIPCLTPSPPEEEIGKCFYEISGKRSARQQKCLDAGGLFGVDADGHEDGSDHCVFDVPGVSLNNFQLAPGLSDEACLDKHSEN